MMHWGASSSRQEFFSTGRLVTCGVLLVAAGMAAPVLQTTGVTSRVGHAVRSADTGTERTPLAAGITAMGNRVKVMTTRSRMRGIRAELKMWTERNGTPPTGVLSELVGERTATDAWGRRISYLPPTSSSKGWLRSKGVDPHSTKDDVWLPLALTDLK